MRRGEAEDQQYGGQQREDDLQRGNRPLAVGQPVNAVYYRNTSLSSRITAFLDFIAARMPP